MSKGCYTCRRRRIICDNGLPTCRKCRDAGKECLGYQKPLVWVKGGVASRGKMMGRSFNEVMRPSDLRRGDSSPSSSSNASPPSAADSPTQSIDISLCVPPNVSGIQGILEPTQSEDNDNQDTQVVLQRATPVSAPWGMVDPLFKDLSQLSRFYIVHCMFARFLCPCDSCLTIPKSTRTLPTISPSTPRPATRTVTSFPWSGTLLSSPTSLLPPVPCIMPSWRAGTFP